MSLKLSKKLFFFSIIFAPLFFGTTEIWSYTIIEISVALAFLCFFIHTAKHNDTIYKVPGVFPLALFLLYILLQIIPLPPAIIELLSPAAYKIHSDNQLLSGTTSWMCISLNQKATLTQFMRYATYVMFYILTVHLSKDKGVFQAVVFMIAIFGGLLAFSSILQFYMTENMALWFRHRPVNSIVVGPYANHNHYAGLMELMFPVVLGLFLYYRPKIGNTSLVKGIAEIFNQEKANIHILIGASALLIIISIFVSLSRGAMISTCLSLVVFTLLLLKRRISKSNTTVIIAVVMVSALALSWFGWDQILNRFAQLKNAQGIIYESRLDFWKDTQKLISDYQITGSGMGTFPHIYPSYRTLNSELFLTHAHNDYLELMAETGIIGFCLAALFILILFYKTYKTFLSRRDGFSIYIYIGSVTAILSILFHSFTDFNLHIGANGLWFFFIAGIAVSAANTGIRKQSRQTRLVPVSSVFLKTVSGILCSMVLAGIIVYNVLNPFGYFYYSNIRQYEISVDTPTTIIKKIEKLANRVTKLDPLHADAVYLQANAVWFLKDIETSRHLFFKTLNLNPIHSRHLNRYAHFLAKQGADEKAGLAFKNSMVYDKSNPEYTFQYGTWLFSKNNFPDAVQYMKKTLMLDDKMISRVLTAMIINGFTTDQMADAIPDQPESSIGFARFLYSTGRIERSVDQYLDTLEIIENRLKDPAYSIEHQNRVTRSFFLQIYWFFKKHNELSTAMLVLERAEKNLPMDPEIKVKLGDLYYQQDISYKALEKYDHALILDPDNKRASQMVKQINQ